MRSRMKGEGKQTAEGYQIPYLGCSWGHKLVSGTGLLGPFREESHSTSYGDILHTFRCKFRLLYNDLTSNYGQIIRTLDSSFQVPRPHCWWLKFIEEVGPKLLFSLVPGAPRIWLVFDLYLKSSWREGGNIPARSYSNQINSGIVLLDLSPKTFARILIVTLLLFCYF